MWTSTAAASLCIYRNPPFWNPLSPSEWACATKATVCFLVTSASMTVCWHKKQLLVPGEAGQSSPAAQHPPLLTKSPRRCWRYTWRWQLQIRARQYLSKCQADNFVTENKLSTSFSPSHCHLQPFLLPSLIQSLNLCDTFMPSLFSLTQPFFFCHWILSSCPGSSHVLMTAPLL